MAGACEKSGQSVHFDSPLNENVSTLHTPQSEAETEALTVEKRPGPHGEHCVLLSSELKNPAVHAWQSLL